MHALVKHAKKSMSGLRERFAPQKSDEAGQPNMTAPPAREILREDHNAPAIAAANVTFSDLSAPLSREAGNDGIAMLPRASSVYSRNTAGELNSYVVAAREEIDQSFERPEWAPEWFPDFYTPRPEDDCHYEEDDDDTASAESDRTITQEKVASSNPTVQFSSPGHRDGRTESQVTQGVETTSATNHRRSRAMTMLPAFISSRKGTTPDPKTVEDEPRSREEQPIPRRIGRLRALTSLSQIFRRSAPSPQEDLKETAIATCLPEIPHHENGEFWKLVSRMSAESAGRMLDLQSRRIYIDMWKYSSRCAKEGPMSANRLDNTMRATMTAFVPGEGAVLETSSGRRLPLKYQRDPRGINDIASRR